MAIIRSIAMGRARKSLGNVTMRTVRGRTIASEKVGPRPITRVGTAAQLQREAIFGLISRFARMHSKSIGVSFDRTKFGSERNYFMKLNYYQLKNALQDLAGDVQEEKNVTDSQIEDAVTNYATSNPGKIVRIRRSGYDTVYLDGAWDSVPDPEPITPDKPYSLKSAALNGSACVLSEIYIEGFGKTTANPAELTLVGVSMSLVERVVMLVDGVGTGYDVVETSKSGTTWVGTVTAGVGSSKKFVAINITAEGVEKQLYIQS